MTKQLAHNDFLFLTGEQAKMVGIGVDDRRLGSFGARGDVCSVFLGRMGMAKTYTPPEGSLVW